MTMSVKMLKTRIAGPRENASAQMETIARLTSKPFPFLVAVKAELMFLVFILASYNSR